MSKRWLHSACIAVSVDSTFTWEVCVLFQILAAKVKETNTALHKGLFACELHCILRADIPPFVNYIADFME